MRVIFCGGGTMGHVSPALAIAEALVSKDRKTDILFVGRDGGEENEAIKKASFKLKTLEIYGIQRKLTLKNIKRLLIARRATKEAMRIIKDFSPDVVVGTGGYVCFPVLRAAKKLKIPTAIHESNAAPGLVTRLLAGGCDRVFLNLPGTEKEFRKKDNIRIVGNPVRRDFSDCDRASARRALNVRENEFLIVSFGGSGGSEKINECLISFMKNHSSKNRRVRHIHATGKKYYKKTEEIRSRYSQRKNGCEIRAYIDNMPTLMSAADLVISRCGAMTIAELSAAGTASILIPSPNVTGNHQYKNARLLSDAGAAVMLLEEDLTEKALTELVRDVEDNPEKRQKMREKIKQFYISDSRDKIIAEIAKIVK